MTKIILHYFGIMARGEPTRLTFVQGGLPFTNKAYGFAEFQEIKPTLPCGALPVLEIQDEASGSTKMVDQSNAILRYVGKLGGLYPSDPLDAMEVDSVIDTIEEADKYIGYTMAGPKGLFLSEETFSDQQKVDIRKKLLDPAGPKNVAFFLSVLEKKLDMSKTGWFVGDKPTIADMRAHQLVAWLSSGMLDGIPKDCMDAYPLLQALEQNIEALPAVAAYRAKYGKKYSTFDYTP